MTPAITPALATFGGETMGTTWCIKCVAPRHDLHALHRDAEAVLHDVVAQMSHWEPASDISRFNRAAAGWHPLPQALFEVLQCAMEVARDSDGAFDPAIGALVRLWGFGPNPNTRLPPAGADIEAAHARGGWRKLALRQADRHAFQPGGLQLDLSAIAKGHAVDRVASRLRELGIADALVEIGGELLGRGAKPDGTPWRVLVEHDPDDEAMPPILQLDGRAVATSGERWHRHHVDGRDYAHTLDPRTGRPLNDAPAAVTVVAERAMHADAWATALGVLGPAAGLAWAHERGIAARFLLADGSARSTSAFDACVLA